MPEIAQSLPQPVTSAEVLSVEIGEEENIAHIRYSGESGEVTVRTQWREIDGRPSIVAGAPVD